MKCSSESNADIFLELSLNSVMTILLPGIHAVRDSSGWALAGRARADVLLHQRLLQISSGTKKDRRG